MYEVYIYTYALDEMFMLSLREHTVILQNKVDLLNVYLQCIRKVIFFRHLFAALPQQLSVSLSVLMSTDLHSP